MWNYIYYITYLDQKEKTEFNGNETYVWNMVENNELSWYPINRYFTISRFTINNNCFIYFKLDP